RAGRALPRRRVEAWEAPDRAGFVGAPPSDAVLPMPPIPLRYVGRKAIASFFALAPRGGVRPLLRVADTRANRQPVVAAYWPMPGGQRYRATVLSVLSLDGDAIAAITAFPDRTLFPVFGLPTEIDAAGRSSPRGRSGP